MDNTKFVVALVVVLAGTYLWYQRGISTRDHEVCMDATQTLFEQHPGQFALENTEQFGAFIDGYNGWYGHCRAIRLQRRDPEMYEFFVQESKRQDTE
jgi:hypothetical protein